MTTGPERALHPIAVEAARLLDPTSDPAELRRALEGLFESKDLLWALESLVVIAQRIEGGGSAEVAAEIMRVATSGTGALRIQSSQVARERFGSMLREVGNLLGRVQQAVSPAPAAKEGVEPAWKLEQIAVLPRRV